MSPTWLGGVKTVVQAAAGALPALLVVVFAGLLALLALGCGPHRRSYALAYADRLINLAAVLVGTPQEPVRHQTGRPSPTRRHYRTRSSRPS
jgi:hypothetical protein